MTKEEFKIIKVELPDGEVVEFIQRIQTDELLQERRKELPEMNDDEWKQYVEKRQQEIDNLPQWTIEFVQREWYREFLETFPLNENTSLLEVLPVLIIWVQNYIDKYNLAEKLENHNEFFRELLWDFIHLHCDTITEKLTELKEKYGEIYNNDWHHLILWTTWFERNMEVVVKLDKKYNLIS